MRPQNTQSLSKNIYLKDEAVQGFIHFLKELINGAPIHHALSIRDKKLPKNDPRLKTKNFAINSLEEAFNGYWWNKEGYEKNAQKLQEVQMIVRAAIKTQNPEKASSESLQALRAVLKWGAGGTGQKLYTSNEKWAIKQASSLAESLSMGCAAMSSETPNLQVFKSTDKSTYARMNAGFTKYYALACDDAIIYDGRVGAALGLLAKEFCKKNKIETLPSSLAFRWGPQNGKNPLNRNPSDDKYVFAKLPTEGEAWAEWNIKGNWILSSALSSSDAHWCSGPEGLRRVEAALFVMGYSLPLN
jgi:hypothetical protein